MSRKTQSNRLDKWIAEQSVKRKILDNVLKERPGLSREESETIINQLMENRND